MNAAPFSTRHVVPAGASSPQDRPHERLRRARPVRAGGRALVLGGGGATGNAWLIGVVAGLLEGGVDVTDADLVIGTSAGATAAAQITTAAPSALLDAALAVPPQRTAPPGSGGSRAPRGPAASVLESTGRIIAAAEDPADMRRRMGAAALGTAAASDGSAQTRWRDTVAARLARHEWPERPVLITAVDARTGEPVVFDRHSGVDLVDAVAASCANGFAYGIGEGRFIDGGYRRSSENADLAAGYRRVLVLSPLGGRSRHPREWGMELAAQVGELRASGSSVETVVPDAGGEHLFGANATDPSLRPPAARAGHDQGRALAAQLSGFWH